ncbi:MAG: hypothetical protein Tsb004_25060 [Allomuricauda sp.]
MKNWFKYITTLFAGAALLATSCEDPDVVIDEVTAGTERGAVLRTVNLISNELPIGNDDSNFAVELEIQDSENGDLVSSVEIYLGFRDNTVEEGETDLDTDEVLIETVEPSSFETGPFGLPRFGFQITLPEMVAALPISDADVNGSDQFTIRFELVLTDGRRYSFADNTGTLTGSFFSSPFLYTPTVVCPPKAPTPGTWTIEMQDAFGDGWQPLTEDGGGPGLIITLSDGTVYEIGLCSDYETYDFACTEGPSSGTATFEVPEGIDEPIEFDFQGDFWEEMSFQIITPNGNVVADVPPATEAGLITIDFCQD